VVVAVAVAIVVVKPWSTGPTTSDGSTRFPRSTAAAASLPDSSRIAEASGDPESAVADICLEVGAWLVTSIERDTGRTIRVWRTMQPARQAAGPLDPRIPQMPVRSEAVLELGWCAPDKGLDAPSERASVNVWRTQDGTATRIHPVNQLEPSAYGALYLPAEPAASGWEAGTYVFRHLGSDGQARWFSLRLELRPARTSGPDATPPQR
jgi:hypothetical protein